ncbi:MAG TPA: VTT domain-containing protein [Candidatus Binatia bacterium]|nr:VTT domain-containing protein [Candidatus Binatia bacterium]
MIHSFIDFIHKITQPEELSHLVDTVLSGWWIYIAMAGIIFAETGLLLGFVLPGDSLLFTLGVVAGSGKINIFLLIAILFVSAMIGDSFGYYLGHRTGPRIFSRPDSRFFKQEYIHRTQIFFEKYGGKTVLFARFIPVIRSFAPFMAGVGKLPYPTFLTYSLFGNAVWVGVLTMLGFYLGNVPLIKNNFEKAILIVIAISFLPAVIEYIRHKRTNIG